jgi:hypothetical protein
VLTDPVPGVIVAGMHRSGTSAVTRTLNLFGLSTSPAQDLIGPGLGNERGHWESASLTGCNDRLLGAVGATWDRPPAAGGRWLAEPAVQALKPLCATTFQRVHAESGWVWKDPRVCLTLDLWLELIQRPAIVLVLRHPADIAQSLRRRNGITLNHGVTLWERYLRDVLRGIRGLPVLVMWFDDLIDDTESSLDDLSALLSAVRLGAPDAPRQEMRANLESGLRHQRRSSAADRGLLTFEQSKLLALLRGIAGFHQAFPELDLPAESVFSSLLVPSAR